MSGAMTLTLEIQKPQDKWSNKDFVIYFSNRKYRLTGQKLDIPPEAWIGFCGRVKAFRLREGISAAEYRHFIDDVFDIFFAQDGYVPSFGAIISAKVYRVVQKMKKHPKKATRQDMYNNEDFVRLRDELYKDISLFRQAS